MQEKAYSYLSSRDYGEEMKSHGANEATELTPEIIQQMIDNYVETGESDSNFIFDTAFDFGVAMALIGGLDLDDEDRSDEQRELEGDRRESN